jgi:hypothetical protein
MTTMKTMTMTMMSTDRGFGHIGWVVIAVWGS